MISRVLVVDDEEPVHQSINKSLKDDTLELDHAKDGREAMELLSYEDYDLLITDLKMPHKTGEGLVELLRSISNRLPIIILSGYITDEIREKLGTFNNVNFMNKPFRPDELRMRVKKILAEKSPS